ncbi:MAG: MBL fold metallo-hydrolase RNA specificity domain-containing protein [Chloroflexota bacterium]
MKITFHGAVRTVTGSQHLLDIHGTKILLDCGLYQGRRDDTYARNLNFPFTPADIDLVVLSHAHIDHSGNLPNLVKQGFRGDILCTSATRDLAATMLSDSGYIQERDVEYLNKKRHRQQLPALDPIYTQEDAIACLHYFVTQSYYRQRRIAPGIYLTLYDAGHMLGSAIVQLDIEQGDSTHTVLFSGDLGRTGIPIIRDPDIPEGAHTLLLESTYGNRIHDPYFDAEEKLRRIVNETHQRGGSIVVPAFAVGRTQQLVFTLHQLREKGAIPAMPIYVDSPLAVNATSVFQLHPELYDNDTLDFMDDFDVRNPFSFENLTYIRSVSDSKALNEKSEPHIIISASGMAEFGRVVHHLRHRITDAKNTILIVGWQAPNTLGRKLVDGVSPVSILGQPLDVNAKIEIINGFSGHADRNELLAWVGALKQKPEHIYLVHGEEESALALQTALEVEHELAVTVPLLNQSVRL